MDKTTTPVPTPIAKPQKPWPDFPLYWHPRGYWMCKRDGREWRYEADAQRSYERYLVDQQARREGLVPARVVKRYALRDAVNLYLTRQHSRMNEGAISSSQFARCRRELEHHLPLAVSLRTPLMDFCADEAGDLRPGELFGRIRKQALKRGLQAAEKHITIVRACLDYAARKKLMRAPEYGDDFDKPSPSLIDRERNRRDLEHGERAWTIEELRRILAEAKRLSENRQTRKGIRPSRNPHLYAQILLALFCGFGSDDCCAVPEAAILRDRGVIKFPRVKNGRPRVAALPARVLEAIDWSLKYRARAATDDARHLLFRTAGGDRCNAVKNKSDERGVLSVGRNDGIGRNFTRLVKRIGLARRRTGFKTLRAMCRTLCVSSGVDNDLIAVVMGRRFTHKVDEYYLRGNLRDKLFQLAAHIENQLFPPNQTNSITSDKTP